MGDSDAELQEHNERALHSLMPLLEAHLDKHGSIVPRAQWESTYDPPPKGWVPPPPEPDCDGDCLQCHDFESSRCTLREEAWAAEWARLWGRYPQLKQLDELVNALGRERPQWGAALYWVYVQPWDAFERTRRETYAAEGIRWIAKECTDWLPIYVAPGTPAQGKPVGVQAEELQAEGLSIRQIARRLDISKSTIHRVLKVRLERTESADGA